MKQSFLIILTLLTLNCFGTTTKVTRVIDGDTFETETGEKVRLVGINAPEIRDIFGEEAKQHLISLIENKTVDLEADHISSDRDRYGRLLRYVILNNTDINKQMVLDGYAFAYLKYHFDKEEEYKQAELFSKQENKGIWNNQQSEAIKKEQAKNDNNIFSYFTFKNVIVTASVLLLLIAGIYYYYKK
ncbi:micrococcal nuclease [Parafilimonas terrae]|uniref:Micrococcal nuclease n=2 Tax=Parafilimonas terrae TaxID=1465490 RepID=A0A1I5VZB1_9BACT|nr:micrococcal nuclease [Parafilimonas terrae]